MENGLELFRQRTSFQAERTTREKVRRQERHGRI